MSCVPISQTFQRIRTNRQGRLRAKTRKRKGDSESDFTEHIRNAQCQSCPVCHSRLQRTPEEIAQHVEECLQKVRTAASQQLTPPPMNCCTNSNTKFGLFSLRMTQTGAGSHGQSRSEEEDETVDVESYGDETSNCAVNLASQNNNNTIASKINATPRSHHPFSAEEHMITSRSNLWQTPSNKHPPNHHRIGNSPSLHHSLNCGPVPPPPSSQIAPGGIFPGSNESTGATPTSSDQIAEYDQQNIEDASSGMRQHSSMGGNTNIETDEDVIVDNSNEDDVKKSLKDSKRNEKNR